MKPQKKLVTRTTARCWSEDDCAAGRSRRDVRFDGQCVDVSLLEQCGNSESDSYADADDHCHTDPYGYADGNCDAKLSTVQDRRVPDRNSYSDSHNDGHGNSDTDIAANSDRGSHVVTDGGSGFDADEDSDRDSDNHADDHCHAGTRGDADCDLDSIGDRGADIHADDNAFSDADFHSGSDRVDRVCG